MLQFFLLFVFFFFFFFGRWHYNTDFWFLLLSASGYIWDLACSSLHSLSKNCGSGPSLQLLLHLGSLLPCFCCSCCCHWDGGLLPHVQDPLSHRLGCCNRRRVARDIPIVQLPPLCVWCDGTGSAIESGGAGAGVMGMSAWEGLDPGPTAPFPVARVWLWNGRWSCVCHLPYCSWFSEAVGSAAMVRGLGLQDTDSAAPLVPAHRCVSVLPPLDV